MTLDEIPLFAMLKSKLSYTNERQRLIAQNIANADTPGYAPMDLKPFTFQQALNGASGASAGSGSGGLEMQRSDPRHMAARRTPAGPLRPMTSPDTEARLDGNQVVLEDQMMKMSEARDDYDTAITFYTQALNLLRTAARAPGK
jgi:flagellar basal-body rod protein FlgB